MVAGLTVLIMTIPLLLLGGLTLFNSRLAQADHDLTWAATSAARAGANCANMVPNVQSLGGGGGASSPNIFGGFGNEPARDFTTATREPCTLQEVARVIEETIRSLLLDNRRLFCLNTSATGMVVEYLDYDGELIYGYSIGSLLFYPGGEFWPDWESRDFEEFYGQYGLTASPTFEDIADKPELRDFQFLPPQETARRDFRGDEVYLTRPNSGDAADFENTTMQRPLGEDQPVGQLRVSLLCDYAQGSNSELAQCAGLLPQRSERRDCSTAEGPGRFLARASAREASAVAVVPIFGSSESL